MIRIICLVFCGALLANADECKPSITTASGSSAPKTICSGQLIYHEPFDVVDKSKWTPLVTFWDGGNNEFQWYNADDENSFAKDGKLYITPTLTADKIGADQVEKGHIKLQGCTDANPANCERQAGGNIIINPVRSARLASEKSFSFKYGRVVYLAKIPQGDWLWPALWLFPTQSKYGAWPRSGEIDLLEARGNVKYGNDVQIGIERMESALHFGPAPNQDGFQTSLFSRNNATVNYHSDYHAFEFIWNESGMKFMVDGVEYGNVAAGDGFWSRGKFPGDNIWKSASKMAPFDQEFHFIINLAVGGNFFPDLNNQNGKKPWNNPQTAMKDFWNGRGQWQPTWKDKESTSFLVDDIKVYAI